MNNRTVVIGSGLGGLSAAIRLAGRGHNVTVFEKNKKPGGKMNELVNSVYRFDTGPSLLTMPFVLEELFQSVGRSLSDYVKLKKVDPVCRYYFNDGSMLDTFEDHHRMIGALNKFSPGQEDAYKRFMDYSEKLYEIAGKIFLQTPIHEWRKVFNKELLPQYSKVFQIDAFKTMHKGVSKYFSDPRLVQLFDRYATYSGSNPFESPATLNIIPHVEFGLGAYYVGGGMYRLVEGMKKLAEELGVKFHFETPVEKIVHKNGQVAGVKVASEIIEFDQVVCNSDVIEAYNNLIDDQPKTTQKFNKLEPSLSGMVFFWGVNRQNSDLKHHNIFFSQDYQKEFKQLFDEKKPADDPTIYVSITSKSDMNQAPRGAENWFVLVNMPHVTGKENWQETIQSTREAIFTRLNKSGIHIQNRIDFEAIHTPLTYKNVYQSYKGGIYGIASNNRMTTFMRPSNRSKQIDGLYFAGGSAHPGGGIPLVVLSGKFAADLIEERNQKQKRKHLRMAV